MTTVTADPNSTQVETDATGAVSQLLRYAPYGEVKYRMNNTFAKYEFTGYETEPLTELQYARARFYDPDLVNLYFATVRAVTNCHNCHDIQVTAAR